MNKARWKNKMLKYFQSAEEYLHCVAGTLNQGPICGKTLSTDLKKACHGFLDCKKFRFSAGLLNGAVGRLRGAFYHRFYGGREGRMGAMAGEGRDAIQSQSRQLARNAARWPESRIHHEFTQIDMLC